MRGRVGERLRQKAPALVVGFGKSGRAAARLIAEHGGAVRVADARTPEEVRGAGAEDFPSTERYAWFSDSDASALDGIAWIVKSPGVAREHPLLVEAQRATLPVFGELELGWAVSAAPLYSVTGSNGKSTTTSLLAAAFAAAEVPSVAAGNIGDPLSAMAPAIPEGGAIAVEVSSFQIEDLTDYRSRAAVLLNVTPDHLDRHGSLEEYRTIKTRLLDLLEPGGVRIVNGDDPVVASEREAWRRADRSHTWIFSLRPVEPPSAYLEGETLVLHVDRRESIVAAGEIALPGPHNLQNALAAALAARAHGVSLESLRSALRAFRPLRHRLEDVGVIDGVRFVNDSKATNLDSLRVALRSFAVPVVLIAGGRDKQSPFEELAEEAAERVRHAVLIGEAARRIAEAWPRVPRTHAGSLEEAVRLAFRAASPAGVVLLAPGCASFDMFRNYADRGDRFRASVETLARESSHG